MSNLNNNTTQLEALLAKVNALPEAGGADTSDATAIASEIFAGETAYTADGKVTGTFTIEEELTEQNNLISQISALVATKAKPQGGTGVETCTVTISGEVPVLSENIYYIDGTSNYKQVPFPNFKETITITVQKYSLLMSEVFLYPSGDATRINSAHGVLVFIYGDATLTGM